MAYFKYHSKNIYYQESGTGTPVIMLHGNTASSKMFELLLPLYQDEYKVILPDFLGNGQSDRLERFPDGIWYHQGLQVIALAEHLKYDQVHLIGTSGGAWSALNAALKRPDLFRSVTADSFDGRTLHPGFSEYLIKDRRFAAGDPNASQFYEWCQGPDWRQVVEADTLTLLQYEALSLLPFPEPLSNLAVPLLLIGSKEDPMLRTDLIDEFKEILKLVPNSQMHIFEHGDHPAILTNAEETAKIIHTFINSITQTDT